MMVRNVFTNISGRAKFEKIVSREVWKNEILPSLPPFEYHGKAKIGNWFVESAGDDAHVHEFFCLNWEKAPGNAIPQIRCYSAAHLKDLTAVRKILGLKTEGDVSAHRKQFLEFMRDPRFRVLIKDENMLNIETFSLERQNEIALRSPTFIYCPEERASLSLNTTYYGQFKSKSCLGVLEELLIMEAPPENTWLSMHAGAAEYVTDKNEKRCVVIVGPTGTAKSTHVYGLVSAKKQNRMHSDDWLYFHTGTGQVLAAEASFYMRTQMAGFYPELESLFLKQPLENVPLPELCRTPASRVMLDPAELWDDSKRVREFRATDLFIVKRDYGDPALIRKINVEQMLDLLTSKNNVFQYANPKAPGQDNSELLQRTTEPYLNPYLCRSGHELDKRRTAAWRSLSKLKGLNFYLMNVRLPVLEMQERLKRFLETNQEE